MAYPTLLTASEALKHLEAIVAEFGEDYVYQGHGTRDPLGVLVCHYVHNGKPDCLVGHVAHRHGVPLDILAKHEGASAYAFANIAFTQKACAVLVAAQAEQDRQKPWHLALTKAREAYHRLQLKGEDLR